MKASLLDSVRLLVDMPSDIGIIPKGSGGAVLYCYTKPREAYGIDVSVPDDREFTGYRYDNIILTPDQFEVVERYEPPAEGS